MKRVSTRLKAKLASQEIAIGITGSPGTGKKAVGKKLAKLAGLRFISLNGLAQKQKTGFFDGSEFLVNTEELRKKKIDTKGAVLVGHLLPYVIPTYNLDFVAILRCSPAVLQRRYTKRGYSRQKISDNLQAEMLDLVSFEALRAYGRYKISEFDTTRKKTETIASEIIQTLKGNLSPRYGEHRQLNTLGNLSRILLRTTS